MRFMGKESLFSRLHFPTKPGSDQQRTPRIRHFCIICYKLEKSGKLQIFSFISRKLICFSLSFMLVCGWVKTFPHFISLNDPVLSPHPAFIRKGRKQPVTFCNIFVFPVIFHGSLPLRPAGFDPFQSSFLQN